MSIWVLKSFHATNQTKELDWLSYLSNILSPTGQKVGGSKKIVPPLSKPWRRPCVCLSVQSHAGILSKRLRVLKLFHLGYITSHTILVFAHQTVWQYSASRGKHASHSHRLKNIGLITPYSIETKLRGGGIVPLAQCWGVTCTLPMLLASRAFAVLQPKSAATWRIDAYRKSLKYYLILQFL